MRFTVYGPPQGKGRPRFTRSGHAYTPRRTAEYEALIKGTYLAEFGGLSFEANEPLIVQIEAVFEPPRSASKKAKERKLNGEFPTKKPDVDNICKIYLDAMNKVVYPDDKQVAAVIVKKIYGEQACVNVEVERIER